MPNPIDAGRVFLDVAFDGKQISRALTAPVQAAGRDVERQLSRSFGTSAQNAGRALTRNLTPAMVGLGAASMAAFAQVDGGLDAIRATTGATGAELKGLEQIAKNVGGTVTAGFAQVGQAVGDLAASTDLAGESLEAVVRQVLQLEQVGNAVSTAAVSQALQDWGVAAEDSAGQLDLLFRASQETGTPMERLLTLVKQYGAPLRELGFEIDEAAVLLGGFEEAGVNTELAMGGLRIALGKFAGAGRDPQQALEETFTAIQEAGTSAEAAGIAIEVFGRRAGADLAQAISQGRFSFEEMLAVVEGGTDTIGGVAEETADWADKLKMLANQAVEVVGPFGEIGFAVAGLGAVMGPALTGLGKMATFMKGADGAASGLSRVMNSRLTPAIGGVTAAIALAAAAWLDYNSRQRQGAANITSVAEMFRDQSRSVEENASAFVEQQIVARDLSSFMAEAGISVEQLTAAMHGNDEAFELVRNAAMDAEGPMDEFAQLLGYVGLSGDLVSVQLQDMANQFREGEGAGIALRDELARLTTEGIVAAALATHDNLNPALAENEAQLYRNRAAVTDYGLVIPNVIELTEGWSQLLADFIAPAAAYDETVRRLAQTTADSTSDATDSWSDYAEDTDVTLNDVLATLDDQILAQEEWATNFATVAQRIPEEVLPELERLAEESPEILALLADGSQVELDRWVGIAERSSLGFTTAIQEEIERATPILVDIAGIMGQSTADELTHRLASGLTDAAQITNAYAGVLVGNLNPLLDALGQPGIHIPGTTFIAPELWNTGGQIPGRGPDRDTVPAMLTRGEYVVRRSQVDRVGSHRFDLLNAGKATIVPFNGGGQVRSDEDAFVDGAPGGYSTPGDVHRPPSFGAASAWAFDPARATTQEMYEAAVAFVALYGGGARPGLGTQAFALGGGGGKAGAYTAGMLQAYEVAKSMGFTSIGGYRAQGSVKGSDHPRHRAWDFMLPGGQSNKPPGWRLATWHVGHSTDVGAKYLIFDDLINKGGGWYPYHHPDNPGDRNPTLAHRDHLHASYFADGGIVNSATLGILGENGPEAVLPLTNPIPVIIEGFGHGVLPGSTLADQFGRPGPVVSGLLQPYAGDQDAVDAAVAELTRLLDEEERIRGQMSAAERRFNTTRTEMYRRFTEQAADLERTLTARVQSELDSRMAAISGFASITERFQAGWGNSAQALTRNIVAQVESLTQWAASLDDLRERGLDEGLIAALGLDDPANAGQAAMLVRATDAQLAALNAAWDLRTDTVAARVGVEQKNLVGVLGETLTTLYDDYTATIVTLTETFESQLATLQTTFNSEMIALGMDLAAIGTATGLSYGQALEAAALSTIPALNAAGDALVAALAGSGTPSGGKQQGGTLGGNGGRPILISPHVRIPPVDYSARVGSVTPGGASKVALDGPVTLVLDSGEQFNAHIRTQADGAHTKRAYVTAGQAVRTS